MEYHKGCAGPFLFIFYINDITMVPWSISLYAGDLALYHPINPPFPIHLSGLNKHVWRRYTPTSILESGFNPQLVYARQQI